VSSFTEPRSPVTSQFPKSGAADAIGVKTLQTMDTSAVRSHNEGAPTRRVLFLFMNVSFLLPYEGSDRKSIMAPINQASRRRAVQCHHVVCLPRRRPKGLHGLRARRASWA